MIERTFYTVPGHYTPDFEGKEDADFDSAVRRARKHKLDTGIAVARAFVDERVVERKENGTSEYVARRWEVFADGSTSLRHAHA